MLGPVGLDHQGGHAGGQRRGLAGAAEGLQVGGLRRGLEVAAAGVGRGADRPVALTRSRQVHGPAEVGDAGGGQRGDVVADPGAVGEVRRGVGGLQVQPVVGGARDLDHVRVGRRADGVGDAGVAGGHRHGHARGDGRVVEQRQAVAHAGVGVGVQAEGLVEHVDVVGAHGVVDRLQDRGVAGEHQAHQAGPGRHADDADVAAGRQRVCLVDELRQVVHHGALGGDRGGVTVGLAAVGDRARAVAGEVLVVDEDVRAVRPDEVRHVRVHAVGDEGDLHARAGRQLLGVGLAVGAQRVDRLQRLGLDERLGRVGRADGVRAVLADLRRGRRLVRGVRGRLGRLGDLDLAVRDHGGHQRIEGEGCRLRRGDGRREGVAQREVLDVGRGAAGQPAEDGVLGTDRLGPARGHVVLVGRGGCQLVAQHHDHALRRGGGGGGRCWRTGGSSSGGETRSREH